MTKIIRYTSMSGGYDPPIKDGRIYIPSSDKFATHRMNAKIAKIMPHKFLPKHDWSIWTDANMTLKLTEKELLEYFEYPEIGVFNHPMRSSIIKEISACRRLDSAQNLAYHEGKEGKLAMCGFIIRKNIEKVHKACEEWWAEICRGSTRDQISFPYTVGIYATYKPLGTSNIKNNKWFKRTGHKGSRNQ